MFSMISDLKLKIGQVLGDVVALWVERHTRDSRGRGFDSHTGTAGATTLGKLFTPLCLCHQAV